MLRTAQVTCTMPRVEADARRDKLWRAELRRGVIDHDSAGTYACSCCGESHLEFLVIDHIDGAVNNHRRSINRSGCKSQHETGHFHNKYPGEQAIPNDSLARIMALLHFDTPVKREEEPLN